MRRFSRRINQPPYLVGRLTNAENGGRTLTVSEQRQTRADIHIAQAQRITLISHCRQQAGGLAKPKRFGCKNHVRKPRMQGKTGHNPSPCGHPPRRVDCLQAAEQGNGLIDRFHRGLVQPVQGRRGGDPPYGKLKAQRGHVGIQYFRSDMGRHSRFVPLMPQPVTYARLRPPCPAPTLLGTGEGYALRDKPGHARSRVETHCAGQAGVDDYPHTFDRQTGFRNGRRKHYLPYRSPNRRNGGILLRCGQIAVQRTKMYGIRSHVLK